MECSVVKVNDLMQQVNNGEIRIPDYQRPYSWGKVQCGQLFDDLYAAFLQQPNFSYRLGTLILHGKQGHDDIVDGQQRIVTLQLLLWLLDGENDKFAAASTSVIAQNYRFLQDKVRTLTIPLDRFKAFILNQGELIRVMTYEESEAFQFFDSQNSRGKPLQIHDLLKAYHLREWPHDSEGAQYDYVMKWEMLLQSHDFFISDVIYPIKQWIKGRSGFTYDALGLEYFKGVSVTDDYPFVKQQTALQQQGQFQLDQPVLSGKLFFDMIFHYYRSWRPLYFAADDAELNKDNVLGHNFYGYGNWYMKVHYTSLLLAYSDRFGEPYLDDTVRRFFMLHAYVPRLMKGAVRKQTIDKYATGRQHFLLDVNIFHKIYNAYDYAFYRTIKFNIDHSDEQLTAGRKEILKLYEWTTYHISHH